jgi:hypothetical protein
VTPEGQNRVIERLIDTGNADEPWALILLAAMEGEAELNAFLDKARTIDPPTRASGPKGPAAEPPGAYVGAISVEGFRGIGPAATLTLRPGPGLTLVVGRNGSGKSSFAEGLEYLLTGRNYRWEKRPKVWVDGWRNLHHDGAVLKADLLVEGKGNVAVSRTWTAAGLESHQVKCVGPDKKVASLQALGWSDPLVTFRPFLSYNELGSLLEEGPSKLYDALSKVLGLEEFVEVQNRLAGARKTRQELLETARAEADRICRLLSGIIGADDDRMGKAAKALCGKLWDLPALEKLVQGSDTSEDGRIAQLRRITAIPPIDVPGITAAADGVRSAHRAFEQVSGTDAARAKQLADILDEAISFHERHADDDCPVCKAPRALAGAWAGRDARRGRRAAHHQRQALSPHRPCVVRRREPDERRDAAAEEDGAVGDRRLHRVQDGAARAARGGAAIADRELEAAGAGDPGAGVSGGQDTVAREILASARSLLDRASTETSGLWPRAAVLLQRQALEVALKTYWSFKAPGTEGCSMRAQLLCLAPYLPDPAVARRAHHVWAALSRAAHFHPYELPPTQEELRAWDAVVMEVIDATENAWR